MKGQWFIISAVVASGVFLAISVLFRDYFMVDSAAVTERNEPFYFKNIEQQLLRLETLDSGCTNPQLYDEHYRELAYRAEKSMAALGYVLYLNRTAACPPTFSILLASEHMVISKNVDPETVLVP